MQFVKQSDLKVGQRLARPIYSKDGVLLFDRDSKLTDKGIEAIKNFGLIGIFVLEPAEPLPPMSEEDREFERFETMTVFSIQEEMNRMISQNKTAKIQTIVANILKQYGHLEKKINFIQNLRSAEDYVYKHSMNVAALVAMMTHQLNVRVDEQLDIVTAAIVHDIGKEMALRRVKDRSAMTEEEQRAVDSSVVIGHDDIDDLFPSNPGVKRVCTQAHRALSDLERGENSTIKLVDGAKILMVAEVFDTMTAISLDEPPQSEIAALRHMIDNPNFFEPDVVTALTKSINILAPGVSVELNTGDKALVISANDNDILRPMLLSFRDNMIMDLSNTMMYGDVEVVDIMKTMDNRHVMDENALKMAGISVEGV